MIADMSPTPTLSRAILLTSLAALMAFAAPPLRAADRIMTGQYEFTMTTEGKTQTSTRCVTPEEAKSVNGDAKAGRDYIEKAANGACTVRAYDVKGNTVSCTIACGAGVVRTSSATYHGDSFEGDVTTTAGGKTHTAHTKAKRVGACK
jgi:uncharacterized protein DUF3617